MEKKGKLQHMDHVLVDTQRCKWPLTEKFLLSTYLADRFVRLMCSTRMLDQPLDRTLEIFEIDRHSTVIQRGELFHVIVTYGCVPKQVGCNELNENQWGEGESAVARLGCNAVEWSGYGGERRDERKSNMRRNILQNANYNTTLPKTASSETNINQPSWCWFVEGEGTP